MIIWQEITKNLRTLVNNSHKNKLQIAQEVGIHHTSLSHYLSGKAHPNLENLKKLCQVLDCTYDDILGPLD